MTRDVSRRSILKGAGAGLGALTLGTSAASAARPERHVVGTTTPAAAEAAKGRAAEVHRDLDFGPVGRAVAGRFPEEALQGLRNRPDVSYVEPDLQYRAIGQTVPWGIDRVDADAVHANGETGGDSDDGEGGADVAIIDTGIDDDHPDLQANVGEGVAYVDCSGTDCNYTWTDDHDHGTHCAGIAGAVDNSRGVVGVSTAATLHAVKVLDGDGYGYWSDIAAGLQWVADQGYDVASLSLAGSTSSSTVRDACQYAADNGVLVVAAAGNDGPCSDCVGYPAAYDTTVAVSATNSSDALAEFSSTGAEVELAAPGKSVYSTVVDGYATWSGTSMAAPHVAGAAGQLMDNGYSSAEARSRLSETAEDLGLAGSEQGAGLLDVEAGMADGSDGTDEPPTIAWVNPADGASVSGDVAIRIDADDAEDDTGSLSVAYCVDDGDWQWTTYDSASGTYDATWDSTAVADGGHTVWAWAGDDAGNSSMTSVEVTTDNTGEAPTVSWVEPADSATVAGDVPVRIDATDAEDGAGTLTVEYRIDGGTWQSMPYDSGSSTYDATWDSTAVTDGSHTLAARTTDSDGNTATASVDVTTDNVDEAPTISWIAPGDGATVSDTVAVELDASDDHDAGSDLTVEWQVDDGAWRSASYDSGGGTYSASWDSTTVADGDHSLNARALDSAGNTSGQSSVSVTVSNETADSAPTVDRYRATEAGSPNPHAEITTDWAVADADGDLSSIVVKVLDGGRVVDASRHSVGGSSAAGSDSFQIKHARNATFDVVLTVTDAAGHAATATRTVSE